MINIFSKIKVKFIKRLKSKTNLEIKFKDRKSFEEDTFSQITFGSLSKPIFKYTIYKKFKYTNLLKK